MKEENLDRKEIKRSPPRHDGLTPVQIVRLKDTIERYWKHVSPYQSYEDHEYQLCCDVDPNREIAIAEAMADALQEFSSTLKSANLAFLGKELLSISLGNSTEMTRLKAIYRDKLGQRLGGDDEGRLVVQRR